MHYHRMYRHGSLDKNANTSHVTASLGRRYRTTQRPSHPTAGPSGRAYVHRINLYDKIGSGIHHCHWCQATVRWDAGKAHPQTLQVDHLDGDGSNNDPDNLVPACRRCNIARGAQARSDALREAGWWANHDTVGKLGRSPRVA